MKLENQNFLMQCGLSFCVSSKLNANSERDFRLVLWGLCEWIIPLLIGPVSALSYRESFFSKYTRKNEETEKWSAKKKKKKKKLEVPFCEIWFSFGNSLNKGSCYNVCNLIFLLTVLTPLWLLQRPDCFFFLLRGLLNLWYYNAFMDQIQQMCIGHW